MAPTIRLWLSLTIGMALACSAAAADLPYLTDRLANPTYRATLDNLLRGKPTTAWLRTYLATKNGVDRPGAMVSAQGKSYELYAVCEPHNCGGNFLYVLYRPGGAAAVALLTRENAIDQFFGNPSEAEKALLSQASKN
jgi:hypothetical protein